MTQDLESMLLTIAPAAAPTAVPANVTRSQLLLRPEAIALLALAVLAAGVLHFSLAATGGVFVYALDDPYIHLALADRIRAGEYGINPGEFTSPSSSILWPFFLVASSGTALHPYMPLVLNLGFAGITAWLLGRFAGGLPLQEQFVSASVQRALLAVLLVGAANLAGLAFTGLEHNLQVLIAVAVCIALIEYERGATLPAWALAAAAIGPSVRYELFGVTAAVAIVLLFERDWRRLVLLSASAMIIPLAFSAFLLANGNMALPNSVVTKLTATSPEVDWKAWIAALLTKKGDPRIMLAGMIAFILAGAWWSQGRSRAVMLAIATIGMLHFAAGQFGWFYRYEIYAMAVCSMASIALIVRLAPLLTLPLALLPALTYLSPILQTPPGAENIYLQQYQMHRFVAGHYAKPIAVNDLGWVSMHPPTGLRVLDLWGLASNEAVRQKDKSAAWLDDITKRNNAGLAMIYKPWFKEIPASWTKVGVLVLDRPLFTAAGRYVTFYATAAGDKTEIRLAMEAFKLELPPGAHMEMAAP
jgi:hypothetical protein